MEYKNPEPSVIEIRLFATVYNNLKSVNNAINLFTQ